jgi:hypothetical protein
MEDLMVSRRAVRPGARIFARRDAGYRRRAGARAKTFDQGGNSLHEHHHRHDERAEARA